MSIDDFPGQQPPADSREYEGRVARVRVEMAHRSLAALVVTDPANIYYLTGYNAWSFYMPQCLVVPADGPTTLFARAMDAAGAHFTCELPAEQVVGYPEDLVQRQDTHPFAWITARALERELLPTGAGARIAAECDSHFFTARAYLALASGVGEAAVVDSGELVNWLRVVKSEHEIEQLHIAGNIAENAMRIALEAIAPGRRQCDIAAEVLAAQASGTAVHGGDYPAIVPMFPTGAAAGTPHLTWSEAPFTEGEATTIELAGVYGRYHTPLARTVMLGRPPHRLSETASVVEEGMAVALEAMVPGATGAEVHAAFNDVISRHGLVKESRIGYSIGIGYPPDWGERTVSLRAGEQTPLQAGMAFHVILGMWMDGWGYELSESVVVTEDGVDHLTKLPQELTIRM